MNMHISARSTQHRLLPRRKTTAAVLLGIVFLLPAGLAAAQSSQKIHTSRSAALMPDISVMGDIALKASSDESDAERGRVLFREVEIGFQGYLYPNLRADIFLALHRNGETMEPELCEGYLSLLNLYGGLALRAGRVHVDIGKINKVHQHERPYADQPLVLTRFFGDHGLVADGAVASWLAPLPWFLQVDVGRWYASPHAHHEQAGEAGNAEEEHHEHHGEFSLARELTTARLWTGFTVTNDVDAELGVNGMAGFGPHVREHQDDVAVVGADLTLKVRLDAFRRVLLQGEWYRLRRTVPIGTLERDGWYTYAGYRASRYWEFGVRYDRSDNAMPELESAGQLALIATNSFTETARVRLQYLYNTETLVTEWWLQTVFGLGPHSHTMQ